MFQPDKLADLIASKPVTPAPFTLESLIAWLEMKAPDENYNWDDCHGRCLISQYIYSTGGNGFTGYTNGVDRFEYNGVTAAKIAMPQPWTFGAALSRARAYAANQPTP